MSVFNREYVGHGHKQRRLSPTASVAVIGTLSAALWALIIIAAMVVWSSV